MSEHPASIGFVGDVHANARALRAALRVLHARSLDQLVFMGDLLSYGVDVTEVLELVSEEVAAGAVLVLGNHDRLYLDLLAGEQSYYQGLPDWIRESVDYTLRRLDPSVLRSLPFVHEYLQGDLLVAHANPFGADSRGVPSWRYVRMAQDHEDAGMALRRRGLRMGVFGHTHRARVVECPSATGLAEERTELRGWRPRGELDTLLVNVGSVGQPRNVTATSTVGYLTRRGPEIDVIIEPLLYDVQGHLDSIRQAPLGIRTISSLTAFFVPLVQSQ
jgi:predicted phosphodiesterase